MTTKISKLLLVISAVSVLGILAGCTCALPGGSAGAPPSAAPSVSSGCTSLPAPGMVTVTKAFPTGDPASSVILLEKIVPAEVIVGQSYDYQLKVTNLTKFAVNSVVVTDEFSENFTMKSSDPQGKVSPQGEVTWLLGTLQPKEVKVINVSGTAANAGNISSCAKVAYASILCLEWVAVKPALKLEKVAPASVTLCDPIPMKLVVTNTGTGIARNVKIVDTLPAGMTTLDGQQTATWDACDLAAGQSREFQLAAKAGKVVKADTDGVIACGVDTAKCDGMMYQPDKNNIGGWMDSKAKAVWTISVPATGEYAVTFSYGASVAGRGFDITAHKDGVQGTTVVTGKGMRDPKAVKLGTVTLEKGKQTITVSAKPFKGGAIMNIYGLTLTPVK